MRTKGKASHKKIILARSLSLVATFMVFQSHWSSIQIVFVNWSPMWKTNISTRSWDTWVLGSFSETWMCCSTASIRNRFWLEKEAVKCIVLLPRSTWVFFAAIRKACEKWFEMVRSVTFITRSASLPLYSQNIKSIARQALTMSQHRTKNRKIPKLWSYQVQWQSLETSNSKYLKLKPLYRLPIH